jgi:AcrR family transcriptional regulator
MAADPPARTVTPPGPAAAAEADDASTDALIAALQVRGAAEPVIDGRRLRAERGRAAVVAATLELVDGGNPVPTFADIAEVSGVSERTIFRYFPDREALFGAVATEVFPRIAHCLGTEPVAGDLHARAAALVALRLELAERTAGLSRSVERLAPSSRLGAALLAIRHDRLQEQVGAWFAPELRTAPAGAAATVDVLLSTASIVHLRELLGDDALADELTTAVVRLLAPAPRA